MVDAADLKEDGLDMEEMITSIEWAMFGIRGRDGKEVNALRNMLEQLRDDCEMSK